MKSISDVQRRLSNIYNFASASFGDAKSKKEKEVLDYIFRETSSILSAIAKIKDNINQYL